MYSAYPFVGEMDFKSAIRVCTCTKVLGMVEERQSSCKQVRLRNPQNRKSQIVGDESDDL
jgi:hypothetical protein